MPYTPKQHRFFEAVAHGMKPRNGSDLGKKKAAELASEGVKREHDAFGAVAGAPQLSPFARMLARRRSRGMRPVGDGGMLDSGPSPSGHLARGGEVHEESMGEKPEHELPDYPPDVYRGETAKPEPEHIPDPEEDTSTSHYAHGGEAPPGYAKPLPGDEIEPERLAHGGMADYGQDDMYRKYGSEPLYEDLIADDLGPEFPADGAGYLGPESGSFGHPMGPVAESGSYVEQDESPDEDADDHLFDPFDPDMEEEGEEDDRYARGGAVGFARALRRR